MSYLIPTIIEKSREGERAYDIYSRLLKDRIIFLGTEINSQVANALDTMRLVKCDVATIAVGSSASMGTILLSSGTRGKRFALPNATIHIHQPLGGAEGQASDIEITAQEIIRLKDMLAVTLAKNTKQKKSKILKDFDRDFFMTAEEAKKYGLIDVVNKTKTF